MCTIIFLFNFFLTWRTMLTNHHQPRHIIIMWFDFLHYDYLGRFDLIWQGALGLCHFFHCLKNTIRLIYQTPIQISQWWPPLQLYSFDKYFDSFLWLNAKAAVTNVQCLLCWKKRMLTDTCCYCCQVSSVMSNSLQLCRL